MIDWAGPKAAEVLQKHVKDDLTKIHFGRTAYMDIGGVEVHVARSGYTGEDGFEVPFPFVISPCRY